MSNQFFFLVRYCSNTLAWKFLNPTYFLFCYFRPSYQVFFLSYVQYPCLFLFLVSIYFFLLSNACFWNSSYFEIVMAEWAHVATVFIISVSQVFPKRIWRCVGSLYVSFSGLSKRFSYARKWMSTCFAINGHGENNDSDVRNPGNNHAIIIKFRQVLKFHLSASYIHIV